MAQEVAPVPDFRIRHALGKRIEICPDHVSPGPEQAARDCRADRPGTSRDNNDMPGKAALGHEGVYQIGEV